MSNYGSHFDGFELVTRPAAGLGVLSPRLEMPVRKLVLISWDLEFVESQIKIL